MCGRAAALQFASAGAIVYGGDINEKDGQAAIAEIRKAGGRGEFLPLDLTRGESIDAFVDAAVAKIGGAPDIIASVCGQYTAPCAIITPAATVLLRLVTRFLVTLAER